MNDIQQQSKDFEQQSQTSSPSMVREVFAFLGQTKKWWLTPVVVLLLLISVLVILGGSAAAPFIYTLF
jgi:hypothetical protein